MEKLLNCKLISFTPNAEELVSSAAKLCYSSVGIEEIIEKQTEEKVKKSIDNLMSLGHESPIEHISFTFGIEGVSRTLSHQAVRHRIGASYSQQSQRYVKEEEFDYVIPKEIKDCPEALEEFLLCMIELQKKYNSITNILLNKYCKEEIILKGYKVTLEKSHSENLRSIAKKKYNELEKKAIENARAVLPNACETKIVITMNARSLFNFFEHRCCNRAQDEINELAWEMRRLVLDIAPNIFKYSGPSCLHGKCKEGKMSCGKPYTE